MAHLHFRPRIEVTVNLSYLISVQEYHIFIIGTNIFIIKAAKTLHHKVFGKSMLHGIEHFHIPVEENRIHRNMHCIHLIPQLPTEKESVAAIPLLVKIHLVEKKPVAGG